MTTPPPEAAPLSLPNAAQSALTRLRRFLAPPVFEDEDKTYAAATLNTILLSFTGTTLLFILLTVLFGVVASSRNIAVGLIWSAIFLSLRVALQHGSVRLATMLTSASLLLAATITIFNTGTTRTLFLGLYFLAVILATIMLGQRAGLAFALLSIAVVFGLSQAELTGVLPTLPPPTPLNQWFFFTSVILLTPPIVNLARKNIREALARARRELAERQQAEAAQRQLNLTLEQHVAERTAELERQAAVSHQIDVALQASHDQLRRSVIELQRRNHEVTLLSALAQMLQACRDADEACPIIARYLQWLFPTDSGALYILSASRNTVYSAAGWGDSPAGPPEHFFDPADCWALRRGRLHVVETPHADIPCPHVAASGQPFLPYLCAPLIAYSEALGLVYLQADPSVSEGLPEVKQQLALTVAEQIALALANLRLRETLRSQSIRDPLTNLFNRRYMEESLVRELQRVGRTNRPLAVAMLDLDHFKRFNDTFGHAAGDATMRELGVLLMAKVRGGDIACRYGGEEFVLILPEATLHDARQRMESLREAVKQLRVRHDDRPLDTLTLSIGVAAFPEHGVTAEAVLKAADQALYRAKAEGRDRVVTASA